MTAHAGFVCELRRESSESDRHGVGTTNHCMYGALEAKLLLIVPPANL